MTGEYAYIGQDVDAHDGERYLTERDYCDYLVHNALFSRDAKRMLRASGDFKDFLEPHAGKQYPMGNVGMYPRVLKEYMLNWINIPKLAKVLNRGSIGDYFEDRLGLSRIGRAALVENILCRGGAESYTGEWRPKDANDQTRDVIGPFTDVTDAANLTLARTLDDKIITHLKEKKTLLRLLDFGTGPNGETILPILRRMHHLANDDSVSEEQRIEPDYYKYIRVFLFDVSRFALEGTMRTILAELPDLEDITRGGGIVPIEDNFVNMKFNRVLAGQKGCIDIISSGGSLCHQTEFGDFFEESHDLLAPGGVMNVWDWYNGPSFAAPYLKISADDTRRTVFYVKGQDGKLFVKDIADDGRDLSDNEKDEFYRRLEDAKDVKVVYEMKPSDVKFVIANFKTLLGFLGYVLKKDNRKLAARKVDDMDIDDYLEIEFDERIKSRDSYGFNYFEFLEKTASLLDDPRPFGGKKSAYFMIEGTGKIYAREMGIFSGVYDQPFIDLFRDHRNSDDLTMSGHEPAVQIMYTFGRKKVN